MPMYMSFSSPDVGWGDVPESDRMRWVTYMLDFPPRFIGVTAMRAQAVAIGEGSTHVHPEWTTFARDMHAAGFTPERAYLLLQSLAAADRAGAVTEQMRAASLHQHDPHGALVPRPAAWTEWPRLVDDGVSPMQATRSVLAGAVG